MQAYAASGTTMDQNIRIPPWIEGRLEENVITTTIEQAINWGRQSSIWPMTDRKSVV